MIGIRKLIMATAMTSLALGCASATDVDGHGAALLDSDELGWLEGLDDAQKQGLVDFTNQATRDQLDVECGLHRDAANTISWMTRRGHEYVTAHQIADRPEVGVWNMQRLYECAVANGYITAGAFTLETADADRLTSDAVDAFVAANGDQLWNDYGYWAFGGDAFTNDWSKAHFLRTLTNFLSDDARGAVSEHVGTEFASEAAAAALIEELVVTTAYENIDWYTEIYAEHVLIASA